MHLARKTRSSSSLLGSCDLTAVIVSHAEYGLRAASIEDEVRLFQEATHVGARVMACHRMIGMAKEGFAIFGGNAGGAQAARERVP